MNAAVKINNTGYNFKRTNYMHVLRKHKGYLEEIKIIKSNSMKDVSGTICS